MRTAEEKTAERGTRNPERGILKRLAGRVAEAAGAAAGRFDGARADYKSQISNQADLAEKPTGRLDHTWSARNSATARAYEAAIENRGTADWRAGLTTATMAIIEGLDTMLARSRWLIRNDGYAASAQGGYRRRVVGGGITARASARNPDGGAMLKDFNAAHDLLWNAWAMDPRLVDVEQTKCLAEKQAVWMDELFAAGGLLLRAVYTPRPDAVGLAIQEIEYEQLDKSLTSFSPGGLGGNAVYNGIETDAYGAPVAYHVHAAAHPLEEMPSAKVRLPADTCWHLFRKSRIRQRIGCPMMAAVMPALRNLAMYELYTLSKARTEAAYHGFVEEAPNTNASIDQIRQRISGMPPTGQTDNPNEMLVRVENGLFPVLKNGQKISFPTPQTPNSVYPQYVGENLKKIAAGTGLDLPTVTRWYADGNFNTQRKAQLEMEAECEAIQDMQFINGALRGIRELWTEIAVGERKLNAPRYAEARWKAAYLTTNWQGPPVRSVDEIKDQAAWDMKYRSLRGTPQEYCNQQGRDIRDLLSEWQEFRAMAEEYKLGDVLDKFFGSNTANAPKAGMQPDGTGPDGDPGDAGDAGGNGGNSGTGNREPGTRKNGDPSTSSGQGGLSRMIVREQVLASLLGGDDPSTGSGQAGHGGNGDGRG